MDKIQLHGKSTIMVLSGCNYDNNKFTVSIIKHAKAKRCMDKIVQMNGHGDRLSCDSIIHNTCPLNECI